MKTFSSCLSMVVGEQRGKDREKERVGLLGHPEEHLKAFSGQVLFQLVSIVGPLSRKLSRSVRVPSRITL